MPKKERMIIEFDTRDLMDLLGGGSMVGSIGKVSYTIIVKDDGRKTRILDALRTLLKEMRIMPTEL